MPKKEIYNLLDGAIVTLIPKFVTNSDKLFDELKKYIPWNTYKIQIHGKLVDSPRLVYIINFDDNNYKYDLKCTN